MLLYTAKMTFNMSHNVLLYKSTMAMAFGHSDALTQRFVSVVMTCDKKDSDKILTQDFAKHVL